MTTRRWFCAQIVAALAVFQDDGISHAAESIHPHEGGAFSLFGDQITGRTVQLVPNTRIVQAWRSGSWDPGVYSIARFELSAAASGTKLVLDHTGFPTGQAAHLAAGWKDHYWNALQRLDALGLKMK
jgi:activator of HSP90 ATPase